MTGCVDPGDIDLEEARELCRRFFYQVSLAPTERADRVTARFRVTRIGALTIGEMRYDHDIRATVGDLHTGYQVLLPDRELPSVHRGITVTGDPGRALIYRPTGATALDRVAAGCRLMTVKIDRSALEGQLRTGLDRQLDGPVDLAATMDVATGAGRSWLRLVRQIAADAADPHSLAAEPVVADRLADSLIAGLLVAADHPFRDELRRPDRRWRPRPVKRAIEAMAADPAHSFSVQELAMVADVSVRALQAAFHRHAGVTPMAYLREMRLARAHEDLCRADPARETVARVAHRWGFTHLSRFAATYRRRYGVAPSVTLRD